MLRILDSERISLIQEYCLERFGINQEKLENYRWYVGSKNRIYIGPEELKRIKPESIGLCVFRLDKTPKPTTNFLQLFGKYVTKNIIELKPSLAILFIKGVLIVDTPYVFICLPRSWQVIRTMLGFSILLQILYVD